MIFNYFCDIYYFLLLFYFVFIINYVNASVQPYIINSEQYYTLHSQLLDNSSERTSKSFNFGGCIWVTNRTCPDDDVKIYLFTRENNNQGERIYIGDTWEESNLTDSTYNPFHPNIVVIHGYNSDMLLKSLFGIKDQYLVKDNYNVFYVDWSVLGLAPCYVMAVHNIQHVGKCVAKLIDRFVDIGNIDVHIIGFSLGAHVTNYIALNLKDFKLPRITGLDPAMPLFISATNDQKLDASDADFVDVIHTNALIQGKIERCGHVDFYFNGGVLQPGCVQAHSNPIACSHQRAPEYFLESILTKKGFWGWSCSSYINYLLGFCPPTNYLVQAGDECKRDTRHGMYLVTTNSEPPYAIGKWTDLSQPGGWKFKSTIRTKDPLINLIDNWGKLDSNFNFASDWDNENLLSNQNINNLAKLTQAYLAYEDRIGILNDYKQLIKQENTGPPTGNKKINYKELLRLGSLRKDLLNSVRNNMEIFKANADIRNMTSSERDQYLKDYKSNLTLGRIDPDSIHLPVEVN